jgi:large subunit ribosomal protein L3
MSETNEQTNTDQPAAAAPAAGATLNGLFAFKVGMSAVFNDAGERVPVTVLKYEPMIVSQVKTKDQDGYESVQLAFLADRASQTTAAAKKHTAKAGFENGAKFIREIRDDEGAAGLTVGTKISIDSLKKGDIVKVTGLSRGRGFQGPVRRWSFAGGPATHGSGFHRRPGSVGNRTWPGRVMPGKRMAGQWGNETSTIRNLEIVDIIADENVVLVRGSVPGSRNTLIRITKV